MREAPISEDEDERLEAVERYGMAGPETEPRCTELARLARHVVDAGFGLVTAIGEERIWVKGSCGLDVATVERPGSFSEHLVGQPGEAFVVEDAREDPRFAEHPLVAGEPGVRFYAGWPLVSPDEHVLGAVTGLDTEPGELEDEQRDLLAGLASQLEGQLVARRRIRELDEQIEALAGP